MGSSRGELQEIYVIYTDMESSLLSEAKVDAASAAAPQLFRRGRQRRGLPRPFEFSPSVSVVLNNVMHSCIAGFVYSALVDSFCCEQNARMNAMDSANQNAEKLLERPVPPV